MKPSIRILVQQEDFDPAEEMRLIAGQGGDIGAIASFIGLCRSEGGTLAALELEHYPGMAETEILRIAEAAAARSPVLAITVIHRHGLIKPGENIVIVLASSAHRQAALDAASSIMDFLKTHAPFWKKEHRMDGTSSGWVEAKIADDAALARWA
jgi:molybdopterin synthase catalytic subunit